MTDADYLKSVRKLEVLCQSSMLLSNSTFGRNVSSWREQIGSIVFGKICLTATAILKLLPKSKYYTTADSMEIWDIPSICTLSRALIDNFHVFYYLSIENPVNDSELEFRQTLWVFHSESERLEMLVLIKSTLPMEEIRGNVEKMKTQLKNNKFYQSLLPKQQKKYVSGREGIFLGRSEISMKSGINPNYSRAAYKYLSQYVHTYAFSISQLALFRAGDEGTLTILKAVIDYCVVYLSLSIRDYAKLFPDQQSTLTAEVVEVIKDSEVKAQAIGS